MSEFLTTPEIAKFLGFDISYVRRMCADGRIKAKKIGRDWIVLKSNLVDYCLMKGISIDTL